MRFSFLSLLPIVVNANVYLHSPRGSNNRLNEKSAQNTNDERLFCANNNRRGGYNVGDKGSNAFSDESGQYSMQYFQSGVVGNSYLTVEWTNLLGCGFDEDGEKIQDCEIVVQTNCQADEVDGVPPTDSYTLRNGRTTTKMPYQTDPDFGINPQGRCFIDSGNRDLQFRVNNIPGGADNSIQYCLDECFANGYSYAGIQYTRECYCDNDFGRYGQAPLSDCNKDCEDGSGNKCGAGWRNNIYLSDSIAPSPQKTGKTAEKYDEEENDPLENTDDYNKHKEMRQDPYEKIHVYSLEKYGAIELEEEEIDEVQTSPTEPDEQDEQEEESEPCTTLLCQLFETVTNLFGGRRKLAALSTQQEKNNRRAQSRNKDIGLHESWEYFDRCKPALNRYGMECLHERKVWPDPNISPWVDVAIFSDVSESVDDSGRSREVNRCTDDIAGLNNREFYECVEFYDEDKQIRRHKSFHETQSDCEADGGDWLGFYKVGDIRDDIELQSECEALNDASNKTYVWGRPMDWKDLAEDKLSNITCIALPTEPECLEAPNTRNGYLGDSDSSRDTPGFLWKLPNYEEDKRCVFRIRYIVRTPDEPISRDERVSFDASGFALSLAPAKKTEIYEDRSHVFKLLQRPDEISDDLDIHNVVVRGKRGNIVQTYPAVEYDFVPNRLTIPDGDAIHIQWTGSNTHNNASPGGDGQTGDAGEGTTGTDRHNFIQLVDRVSNLVAPDHMHTLFQNADWIWSSHQKGDEENKDFNLALSMATSGYYHCETLDECSEPYDGTLNDQLNNAPASYHGNIFVPSQGEYHFKCMRNDNFSNRSQKGTIKVVANSTATE